MVIDEDELDSKVEQLLLQEREAESKLSKVRSLRILMEGIQMKTEKSRGESGKAIFTRVKPKDKDMGGIEMSATRRQQRYTKYLADIATLDA